METELICFPSPLDTCLPLSYSYTDAAAIGDSIGQACLECELSELRTLLEEGWE